MTLKEKNNEIQKKNQNDLRDLEQFFNTNKVDNMLQKIEEKKKELVEEMVKNLTEVNISVLGDYEKQDLSEIEEVISSDDISKSIH